MLICRRAVDDLRAVGVVERQHGRLRPRGRSRRGWRGARRSPRSSSAAPCGSRRAPRWRARRAARRGVVERLARHDAARASARTARSSRPASDRSRPETPARASDAPISLRNVRRLGRASAHRSACSGNSRPEIREELRRLRQLLQAPPVARARPARPGGRGARSGRVRRRRRRCGLSVMSSSVARGAIGEPLDRDVVLLDQLPAPADLVLGAAPSSC